MTTVTIDPCPVRDDEPLAEPIKEDQFATIREGLNRQRPVGKLDWQRRSLRGLVLAARFARVAGRGAKRKVACPLCDFFYRPIQAQQNRLSALSVRSSFPSFNRCAS